MSAEQPSDVTGIEDVRLGPEIEWPAAPGSEPTFTSVGQDSNRVMRETRDYYEGDDLFEVTIPNKTVMTHMGADSTVGTYGAEFRADHHTKLYGMEAAKWFRKTIMLIEDIADRAYEPVGIMDSGVGSTAGLHIHMSPLSYEQAEELWRMSHEPWMQAFTGSSITDSPLTAKVFRGGQYCKMDRMDQNKAAVRERGQYHWEWRLPEPMRPDHFDHLITMLDRWLSDGRDAARQYALGLMQQDDSPVTAVRRADAVGIRDAFQNRIQVTVDRTPHPETVDFYDTVKQLDGAPYIFRATTPDGEWYYFHSFEGSDTGTVVDSYGLSVEHGTILSAYDLDEVNDQDLRDELHTALADVGTVNPFSENPGPERTDATDFLLDTAFGE